MKASLSRPINIEDLDVAMIALSPDKAPGPDGITTEFYKIHWDVLKSDYLAMVTSAVATKRLPPGVTTGLISLLHKSGEKSKLNNWRPITLLNARLNVAYKLFAKVLQMRLQPILTEIIDPDQMAFLSLRFILDNILLTHKTIEWAVESN